MTGSLRAWRILVPLMALPLACVAAAEDQYLGYSGVATGRHSEQFLYGEQHLLIYRDGRLAERLVLYTCHDGSPFARKTVTYSEPTAPDFDLEDAATGMREGVRSEAGRREVFFRGVRVEPEKAGPLPRIHGLVIDAGFDEFIRDNWSALMTGKPLSLRFMVPSRLTDMGFQLQHVRSAKLDGVAAEVFRLKLAGVLGDVLSGIDVSYAADTHVLMRYEGLSDLRDAAGDNYRTTINFHPSDRKPAGSADWSNAREAQLRACR